MLEERESTGKRVRRARLRLGMTQADLAAATGRTQGWVSKVEKGAIELDRAGIINQIAAALHCHPNDLIERPFVAGTASENQWQVSAAAILRELLIAMACERAAWSARLSGDPVTEAVADWMRVWDMWATADWDDALALSDKALRLVEDRYRANDPLAVRAWGSLHLRAAVSAARAGRRAETEDRIQHADGAAELMEEGRPGPFFDRHSLTFSGGNVQIHAVSVQLEMGDHARALVLNERADPAKVAALPASRRGHHQMDLARAWLWDGNRDKALQALEAAERIAPQLVRNHPIGRATLRKIVYAERSATREKLRYMSDRFHLDG
ncbi:helix-turn-helix domain-containing protein [Kitasatospora sp. NPDC091335]|uniref:helix-turn-helix domain-containing protein n=1 Tax=Kitasatospora sp. NPDC091335 TaxID=3364085 RepID=UPI00381551D1